MVGHARNTRWSLGHARRGSRRTNLASGNVSPRRVCRVLAPRARAVVAPHRGSARRLRAVAPTHATHSARDEKTYLRCIPEPLHKRHAVSTPSTTFFGSPRTDTHIRGRWLFDRLPTSRHAHAVLRLRYTIALQAFATVDQHSCLWSKGPVVSLRRQPSASRRTPSPATVLDRGSCRQLVHGDAAEPDAADQVLPARQSSSALRACRREVLSNSGCRQALVAAGRFQVVELDERHGPRAGPLDDTHLRSLLIVNQQRADVRDQIISVPAAPRLRKDAVCRFRAP